MIGVFVTFRYEDNFDEQAVRKSLTARARFEGMQELRSKAFTLNSESVRRRTFTQSRRTLQLLHQASRAVTGLYGVRPTVEFVEIATLVENVRA